MRLDREHLLFVVHLLMDSAESVIVDTIDVGVSAWKMTWVTDDAINQLGWSLSLLYARMTGDTHMSVADALNIAELEKTITHWSKVQYQRSQRQEDIQPIPSDLAEKWVDAVFEAEPPAGFVDSLGVEY